jgi:hypothetical protein
MQITSYLQSILINCFGGTTTSLDGTAGITMEMVVILFYTKFRNDLKKKIKESKRIKLKLRI